MADAEISRARPLGGRPQAARVRKRAGARWQDNDVVSAARVAVLPATPGPSRRKPSTAGRSGPWSRAMLRSGRPVPKRDHDA